MFCVTRSGGRAKSGWDWVERDDDGHVIMMRLPLLSGYDSVVLEIARLVGTITDFGLCERTGIVITLCAYSWRERLPRLSRS